MPRFRSPACVPPCEQTCVGLVGLICVAAVAAFAVGSARGQDIVATGSMVQFGPGQANPGYWNSGSWTDGGIPTATPLGQWGVAGQPPTGGSTYSTGPYDIYSNPFAPSDSFNGQSLRIPSGGRLFIPNGNTTTSANLILDGGRLVMFDRSFSQPQGSQNQFTSTTITIASDSVVDMSAVPRDTTLELGGSISGSGTLRVTGEGTGIAGQTNKVIFSPNNNTNFTNFTGGFAVDSGILSVNEGIFPSGAPIEIAAGARFELAQGQGAGQVRLGAITGTGTFAFGSNLIIGDGNASGTFDGTFAGLGGLPTGGQIQKRGTGTIVFNGNAAALGYALIEAGTLALGRAASLPPGLDVFSGATFSAGTLIPEATIATALQSNWRIFPGAYFGLDTSLGDRTFTLTINDPPDPTNPGQTGPLNFSKNGTNTLRMMVAQNYTGDTKIAEGAMVIGQTAALPGYNVAGDFSVESGAALGVVSALSDQVVADLLATGNFQPNSSIAFDTTDGDRTYSVNVIDAASGSGALGVTKTGTGTLELSGTNTYTGTTVASGTLAIDSAVSLPGYNTNGSYSVSGGGTMAVGNSVTDNEISDMLGTTNFQAGAVLGFDTTSGDRSYSSAIADTAQGSLGLTKTGTDALTLSGTSTFTGPTTVEDGQLFVNGSLTSTSAVSVAGGALGGTGSIASGLSVGGAGTLSPGDASSPIGAFSAGATTLAAGATFGFEVDSTNPNTLATAADLMVVNGNLNIASSSILDFTDIASSVNLFPDQTTFALINYSGAWDGGLFSFGGSPLADGGRFFVGSQEWQIDYDATSGGSNFTGDYVSPGSFMTVTAITVVPEPATLGLLAAAAACGALFRRRVSRRA